MASTPISGFPNSAVPPPVTYHFVMQDPSGAPGTANYKITYADLAASIGSAGAVWGAITGVLSAQLDLQAALNGKLNVGTDTSGIPSVLNLRYVTDANLVTLSNTSGINTGDQVPFVASGVGHAAGIVPDPGAVAGTTKFLREDATWQVPSGGGGSFATTAITVNVPTPALWTQVTVIDASVVPTSRISIFPGMTVETDMNDWIEGDVVFKATPGTGQFIVDLYTRDRSFLFGDYKLQYAVG